MVGAEDKKSWPNLRKNKLLMATVLRSASNKKLAYHKKKKIVIFRF